MRASVLALLDFRLIQTLNFLLVLRVLSYFALELLLQLLYHAVQLSDLLVFLSEFGPEFLDLKLVVPGGRDTRGRSCRLPFLEIFYFPFLVFD